MQMTMRDIIHSVAQMKLNGVAPYNIRSDAEARRFTRKYPGRTWKKGEPYYMMRIRMDDGSIKAVALPVDDCVKGYERNFDAAVAAAGHVS